MPTKVLLCDTADSLGQIQYALMRSGVELELEAVTDTFRAVKRLPIGTLNLPPPWPDRFGLTTLRTS